ncbi:excinuclease ABC subunit UvrC [Pseudoramibacter sp.]|jgi:excinuclease ABC subunit C|uniref:excinuclease ABC subunit UvrC n=1 Tax=Pseudoramibacter sp. TaxID=2034862 RepID=UPI0025CED41F|nr:excinuclease ABC subunit UvrC [Pseudoramibacter sp.]MCH4072982.1 excinuclease ABC subunit UvrC [Pseudoramibacter sp.]MCH4106753.1 excinuclease ABC subunit UvrC [Pseudoramibacter sp.]
MYDRKNLKNIPKKPGIYIMHNYAGDIIYVGKAKNLFNRIHSYFQNPKKLPIKTQIQVSHIESIETIVVDTEMEALILECNLIKEHRPRYNIMLKDDKSYPYIKITTQEKYPQIIMTRDHHRDGGKYFGPFTNSTAVRQTIEALQKVYPLRRCKRKVEQGVKCGRPCIYFHMGQCLAPCTGKVTPEEYHENVQKDIDILSGKNKPIVEQLTAQMQHASENMEYEKAANFRDKIQAINFVVSRQKIVSENQKNQDYIAFYRVKTNSKTKPDDSIDPNIACVQIFNVRDGKLLGRNSLMMDGVEDETDSLIMTNVVKQYYNGSHFLPKEIILSCPLEDEEVNAVESWLSAQRGSHVQLTVPQKGEKARFIQMVEKNARLTLEQHFIEKHQKKKRQENRIASLKNLLGIKAIPNRIEAYDISNISGTDNVGGMVVFENGKANPKAYRRFKIKTVEGQNDYASMQEMLFRRIEHGMKEEKEGKDPHESSFLPFPEIFMIDGGRTHVEAAQSILSMYPELDITVCGLVKDEHHQLRGVVYQDREYKLTYGTPVCTLLNEISEEVHRFAIAYHRKLRKKGMLSSELESIPGIGKKRRTALMTYFRTIENIKTATPEDLVKVKGMNQKAADAVFQYFNKAGEEK